MFTSFQSSQPASPDAPTRRIRAAKRSQVRRACDACRLTRAKCDTDRPCRNCREKARRCATTGSDRRGRGAPQTLGGATEELERLRRRVEELEGRSSSQSSRTPQSPISPGHDSQAGNGGTSLEGTSTGVSGPLWKGLRVGEAYYGPSSIPYFQSRLYAFLEKVLRRPQPDIASRLLAVRRPSPVMAALAMPEMGKSQQDYYLDLWWMWCHPLVPILVDAEFKAHYNALWPADSSSARRPSPLVDIVLALCMQFSSVYTTPDCSAHSEDSAQAAPGDMYFVRSQLLCEELPDVPSLVSVQCRLLSAVYLINCDLINTAHNHIATALRAAVSLGLHHETSDCESELHQELSSHAWSTLVAMDADLSAHLGRPRLHISSAEAAPNRPPSSTRRVAHLLGPNYVMLSDETSWLAYHEQWTSLANLVGSIHSDLYRKCEEIFRRSHGAASDPYTDPTVRESCARALASLTPALYAWAGAVPAALCATRHPDAARPFDTTSSPAPLELCPHRDPGGTPLWAHRQRLLLELRFHHAAAALLFHPFVAFTPTPTTNTPTADSLPIAAVRHAATLGYMARQALAATECLQGSADAARWLRDAAYVMVGFMASYPVCPPSALARRAVRPTIEALEICGGPSVAADVAELRRLVGEADEILGAFRSDQSQARGGALSSKNVSTSMTLTPAADVLRVTADGAANTVSADTLDTCSTTVVTPLDGRSGELGDGLLAELNGVDFTELDPVGNAEFWASFFTEVEHAGADVRG